MADDQQTAASPRAPAGTALAAPFGEPAPTATAPETPQANPSSASARRRRHATQPGPSGSRPLRRTRDGLRLESRTSSAYPLRDDNRRTVRYLRLIVGQAHSPDEATVAVDVDRITIEWND